MGNDNAIRKPFWVCREGQNVFCRSCWQQGLPRVPRLFGSFLTPLFFAQSIGVLLAGPGLPCQSGIGRFTLYFATLWQVSCDEFGKAHAGLLQEGHNQQADTKEDILAGSDVASKFRRSSANTEGGVLRRRLCQVIF